MVVVVLLLLLFLSWAPPTRASLVLSQLYNVPQTLCPLAGRTPTAVDAYGPWRGPLPPVTVNTAAGTLTAHYPPLMPLTYLTEGVLYNASLCGFCPYSESPPQDIPAEYLLPGGIRYLPMPMFGPCIDGQPSTHTLLSCIQNQILYPPDFVGEYFYPNQALNPYVGFPSFHHSFVEGATSGSITNVYADGTPLAPTDYALGRGNTLRNLGTFQILNNATGAVNTTLTALIQSPYQTNASTGNEGWTKWSQHFCRPACHRDAIAQQAQIRPSDYAGKPSLSFLARRTATAGGGTNPLSVIRCVKCPAYQSAYTWGTLDDLNNYNADVPADPRGIYVFQDCFPWFGSVPTLTPYVGNLSAPTYLFANVTVVAHDPAVDGVLLPTYNKQYVGRPCPVNTFNDRCAHYHKYTAIATLPAPTYTTTSASMPQPQCRPCPSGGFHTAGLTGAWFCLPPPGQTALLTPSTYDPTASALRGLLNMFVDPRNASLLWARRDILGYEWECGTRPEHCYQCASVPGMANKLPHEFNEQVLLANLLVWQACPAGYYCPTALAAPIACPPAFPWSPAGSASQANCTCARGTYLDGGTRTCRPCNSPSMCGVGQFLSGGTVCAQTDGATSGGACVACANAPPGGTYLANGIEVRTVAAAASSAYYYAYQGVCPFDCPLRTQLQGEGACLSAYTCAPLAQLFDAAGRVVFSGNLATLRDGFRVLPVCRMQRNLTDAASTAVLTDAVANPNAGWLPAATTCAQAMPGLCDQPNAICSVTANATFSSNVACGLCASPPANGFYDTVAMTAQLAYTCDVRCTYGFYYNRTGQGNCSSCEALTAAICGGSNMHLRGGGCYGDPTPFPTLTNLPLLAQSNCILCSVAIPPAGQYLDIADPAGCSVKGCQTPANVGQTAYIVTDCGGTTNYITAPCTLACAPGYWLNGCVSPGHCCSTHATAVCTPCKRYNPGFYLLGDCGLATDTVWQVCGVPPSGGAFVPGFYCPGNGTQLPCPNGRTSLPGASSPGAQCFCPAGTVPQNDGTCTPIRCQDATPLVLAPGAGYRSGSYMTIQHLETVCLPCTTPGATGPSAYAVGDGLELGACRCPAGSYAHVAADGLSLTCRTCPSPAPACASSSSSNSNNNYLAVPDLCWTGLIRETPQCQCQPPPFTGIWQTALQAQTAALAAHPSMGTLAWGIGVMAATANSAVCRPDPGMCLPGFSLAATLDLSSSASSSGPDEPVSGSAVYIQRADALAGWSLLVDTTAAAAAAGSYRFCAIFDCTVRHLASTNDYPSWGDPYNLQYAVWTVNDPALLNAYAMPLPWLKQPTDPQASGLYGYDPYHNPTWAIVPADYPHPCTIEGLAVAQWRVPQTPGLLHPSASSSVSPSSTPTDVGAVVMDHAQYAAGTSLWLYLNVLAVDLAGAGGPAWGLPTRMRIRVPAALNSTVAAVGHAYVPPGGNNAAGSLTTADGSTFYVGINSPPAAATQQQTTTTWATCSVVAVLIRTGATYTLALAPESPALAADRTLLAMAVLPSPDGTGVYLYLALTPSLPSTSGAAGSGAAIQLVKWDSSATQATAAGGSDELFFVTSNALAPSVAAVRSLRLLWPSTTLAPTFFALVEPPPADASSAQGVLHPARRPMGLFVADPSQRTFVPIQVLPLLLPLAFAFVVIILILIRRWHRTCRTPRTRARLPSRAPTAAPPCWWGPTATPAPSSCCPPPCACPSSPRASPRRATGTARSAYATRASARARAAWTRARCGIRSCSAASAPRATTPRPTPRPTPSCAPGASRTSTAGTTARATTPSATAR